MALYLLGSYCFLAGATGDRRRWKRLSTHLRSSFVLIFGDVGVDVDSLNAKVEEKWQMSSRPNCALALGADLFDCRSRRGANRIYTRTANIISLFTWQRRRVIVLCQLNRKEQLVDLHDAAVRCRRDTPSVRNGSLQRTRAVRLTTKTKCLTSPVWLVCASSLDLIKFRVSRV